MDNNYLFEGQDEDDVVNMRDDRDEVEMELDEVIESDEGPVDDGNYESDIDDGYVTANMSDDGTGNSGSDDEDDLEDDENIGDRRLHTSNKMSTLTQSEANKIKEDIERMLVELEESRAIMLEKKADGDLSENEAYQTYKERVSGLEIDIAKLQKKLKTSRIVAVNANSGVIEKGTKVKIVITSEIDKSMREEINGEIASEGCGTIEDNGVVKIPENSEVFRKMEGKSKGTFQLTGTDGNNYNYEFEIVRG